MECNLPVSQGGLGVRKASDIAVPAFLSSAHVSAMGMESLLPKPMNDDIHYGVLVEVEELWKELTDNVLQPETKSVQACWDAPIYETQFKTLLKKQTVPSEQARLRAFASHHHSSDWLNCLPIPAKWSKIR